MGQVILGGAAGGVRNVFREVRTHVYAKAAVGDDWTYLPFLTCTRCENVAGPGVGTAEFTFTFGQVRRAETRVYELFSTFFLNRAYVKVVVSNNWGSVPIWYGVVESEQVRPWGDGEVATGKQVFTAYEVSHLLDRCAVVGSYVAVEGGGVAFVDETLVFNGQQNGRSALFPNRWGLGFGVPGEDLREYWTAWQVLDYVFAGFVNDSYGIQFIGHGTAQEALAATVERWDFRGMTAKQILDLLVDRKRGLGWCVVPEDDLSVVYIHVFSGLAEGVAAGEGAYVPPNENQVDLEFAGYRDVEPVYHFGELTHYDLVRVVGGPIYTTASFSFADGTLEKNWDDSAETAYKAGSDIEGASAYQHDTRRKEQDLTAVYQRFRVPGTWDGVAGDGEGGFGGNALPVCTLDGLLTDAAQAVGYRPGKRFERELPWDVESAAAGWTEFNREPLLAFLSYADPNPPDPENVGTVWARAEDLTQLDMSGARVVPDEGEMGIELNYVINHFFALNHFSTEDVGTGESLYTPRVDYETLIVTARFRTDERLKLVARVPTVEFLETGKTKDIFVEEAIGEWVTPGTVYTVTEGALQSAAAGWRRDDMEMLGRVAALAVAFFGQVRATLSFEVGKVSVAYPVGTLVRNTVGPEGVTGVGTVVTRQGWEFGSGGQRTVWQTGYEELDFGLAARGK